MLHRSSGSLAVPGFLVLLGALACGAPNNATAPLPSVSNTGGAGGQGPGLGGAENLAVSDVASGAGGALSTGVGGAPTYSIDETVESWHSPATKTSVYFSPVDDLEEHVLTELGKATKTLRLAFFNIRLDAVKKLLEAKVKAGVDVQVLLDKKQQDLSYNTMYAELKALGVPVKLVENKSATEATLHDKFTIIDGARVLMGSANYSFTALNVSDETLVVTESQDLAARYQLEFDELVAGGNAKSAPYMNEAVRVWMGPEDSLSAKIVTALDSAKLTAVVAMFALQTKEVIDALITAKQRGVKVAIVLDSEQANDVAALADETLSAAKVPVLLAHNTGGNQAEMHSKYLVVDHQLALVGSNNWTNLGAFYNDENMLWIDDAQLAARLEGNFATLLTAYKSPAPATLGLTEGQVQLTLNVANVTLDAGFELQIFGEKTGPFAKPITLIKNEAKLKVPTGTRLEYSFQIVQGATKVAIELAGKKLAHGFTVPFAPGPFFVTDAFVK